MDAPTGGTGPACPSNRRSGDSPDRASGDETATLLAVDDEPALVSLYEAWFTPEYEVLTAETGRAALDRADAGVDVVILDRTLPDVSGECVLRRLAADHDVRVVVVSAVEPDTDVVDLPFDAYLTKPVGRETLWATVEWARRHDDRDPAVARYLVLDRKVTLLERSAVTSELDASAAFQRLHDRRADAARRIRRRIDTRQGEHEQWRRAVD